MNQWNYSLPEIEDAPTLEVLKKRLDKLLVRNGVKLREAKPHRWLHAPSKQEAGQRPSSPARFPSRALAQVGLLQGYAQRRCTGRTSGSSDGGGRKQVAEDPGWGTEGRRACVRACVPSMLAQRSAGACAVGAALVGAALLMVPVLQRLSGRLFSSSSSMAAQPPPGLLAAAFVSCPNETVAKEIARGLVERRLAACVNVLPHVTSIYRWKEAIEEDAEVLLMIKTRGSRVSALAEFVRSVHPYEVAEVISVPIQQGNPPYLRWVEESVDP
ncbi:protein CutA [Erythrolamprus reginae]|uniref:protein CutA n=1 Tax=Erythrolamprus reginae TaxID=121349 RepID=UPI00396CDACA